MTLIRWNKKAKGAAASRRGPWRPTAWLQNWFSLALHTRGVSANTKPTLFAVGLRGSSVCLLQLSVEADGVKESPAALVLKLLQEFVNFVLHVVRVLNLCKRRKTCLNHVPAPADWNRGSSIISYVGGCPNFNITNTLKRHSAHNKVVYKLHANNDSIKMYSK